MISDLIPKEGDPRLDTTGAKNLFFSDCDECTPFLIVSLMGTFEIRGANFLEFKVTAAAGIVLEDIAIADEAENVIHVEMQDDPDQASTVKAYFVRIRNASSLADMTMVFTATRKNRKGAWKYTKASGPIGIPGKKGQGSGGRWLEWFRRRRSR